jgi:hypothetical protein
MIVISKKTVLISLVLGAWANNAVAALFPENLATLNLENALPRMVSIPGVAVALVPTVTNLIKQRKLTSPIGLKCTPVMHIHEMQVPVQKGPVPAQTGAQDDQQSEEQEVTSVAQNRTITREVLQARQYTGHWGRFSVTCTVPALEKTEGFCNKVKALGGKICKTSFSHDGVTVGNVAEALVVAKLTTYLASLVLKPNA